MQGCGFFWEDEEKGQRGRELRVHIAPPNNHLKWQNEENLENYLNVSCTQKHLPFLLTSLITSNISFNTHLHTVLEIKSLKLKYLVERAHCLKINYWDNHHACIKMLFLGGRLTDFGVSQSIGSTPKYYTQMLSGMINIS